MAIDFSPLGRHVIPVTKTKQGGSLGRRLFVGESATGWEGYRLTHL